MRNSKIFKTNLGCELLQGHDLLISSWNALLFKTFLYTKLKSLILHCILKLKSFSIAIIEEQRGKTYNLL